MVEFISVSFLNRINNPLTRVVDAHAVICSYIYERFSKVPLSILGIFINFPAFQQKSQ
jgi:hypothetical protein